MSSSRRRSSRPHSASRRPTRDLETLETRQLLAQSTYLALSAYPLTDFTASGAADPGRVPAAQIDHPIGSSTAALNADQNQGRIITGQDRQGNRYQLKLTGPGYIIVTDATPDDGTLDDDLDTIRLVGTTSASVLTGQVQQSYNAPQVYTQLPTLGMVRFNRLVADSAVKRITLNGFVLTDTLHIDGQVGVNSTTGINLKGGVGRLEFQGIDARFPTNLGAVPIVIQIGSISSPLSVHPDIRIDSIQSTVYDAGGTGIGGTGTIPTGPLTTPAISLVVNGAIASFNVVSITQSQMVSQLGAGVDTGFQVTPVELIPDNSAALQYQFPIVGTTGRTAVQATSIEHIRASGNVTNTTFSKASQPFQNSLTGLDSVGSVQVGGVADAVAIDSRGSIKSLKFAKGLGSPVGVSQNPIYYGTPADRYGYPHNGDVGVQVVTEGNIGSIKAAPNDRFLQTSQDPRLDQGINGTTLYQVRPGTAAQSSIIVAGGSIGKTHVVGDLRNTQVSAGTNYYGLEAGNEGVTAGKSSIGPSKIKGDLVDTVISSSYRSNDQIYGNGNDSAGDGSITGSQTGNVYQTPAGTTALGTRGSGFFSRYNSVHKRPTTKK